MDEKKMDGMLDDEALNQVVGGTGYAYYYDDGDMRRMISSDQPMSEQQVRAAFQDQQGHGGCMYNEIPLDPSVFGTVWDAMQKNLDQWYKGNVQYQEFHM